MALETGLAALTGGLANTEAARTGRTGASGSNSSSSGSRRRRVLTPGQTLLSGVLQNTAIDRITNPGAIAEPLRVAARENVNQNFAAVPDAVRAKYGTTGQASGKLGRAGREAEVARAGALSGVDADFNRLILGLQDSGIGLGERLLSQNFEDEVTGYGTNAFNQQGFNTAPGSAAAGALTGGLQMFATLAALSRFLEGGGG